MKPWRRKLRFATVAVVAVVAAACSSGSSTPASSSGGTPVTGRTVSVALPAGVAYNWIFPFNALAGSSVYNILWFQWLMYRPLYKFGNNTNDNAVAARL